MSICNRNRIMTGIKFSLRVTLRRLDLAAEIYHSREPRKIPQVMSPDETRRVLAVATSLRARAALSLCHGCGLRAGDVVRLKVKHIDGAQKIIRIEQSRGRGDRNVVLSPETIDLLRQWWKARRGFDAHTEEPDRSVTSAIGYQVVGGGEAVNSRTCVPNFAWHPQSGRGRAPSRSARTRPAGDSSNRTAAPRRHSARAS